MSLCEFLPAAVVTLFSLFICALLLLSHLLFLASEVQEVKENECVFNRKDYSG